MRDARVESWEARLKRVFDRIDDLLEEKYGKRYPLHPSRPRRGTTSDKEADGLFDVGAAFTAGYGSEYGRGYVVETRMATLANVPADVHMQIEEDVIRMLEELLPRAFPNTELDVVKDGSVYKIHGDLSLDGT